MAKRLLVVCMTIAVLVGSVLPAAAAGPGLVGGIVDFYSKPSTYLVRLGSDADALYERLQQWRRQYPDAPVDAPLLLPGRMLTPQMAEELREALKGIDPAALEEVGVTVDGKNGVTFVGVNLKTFFDEAVKGVDLYRGLTQGDEAQAVLGQYAQHVSTLDDVMDAAGLYVDVQKKDKEIEEAQLSEGRTRAMRGVIFGATAYKSVTRIGLKVTKLGNVPVVGSKVKGFLDSCADAIFGGFMAWAERHQRVDNCIEDPMNCDLGGSRPGADHPDDTRNVAPGVVFTGRGERALYAGARRKGYDVMTWLLAADRALEGHRAYQVPELDPVARGFMLDMIGVLDGMAMPEDAAFSAEEWRESKASYREIMLQMATAPDIAVLGGGSARGVLALLSQTGHPATLVRGWTDPSLLARFPLLIIPSGALDHWSTSPVLAGRLAAYVEQGGTLVSFTQPRGRLFGMLPGGLEGYGWAEDQSCHFASAAITHTAGAFASQEEEHPDVSVDGYFLRYPLAAEIWLTRTKNGQPCMLAYPLGAGRVVASTLFLDWAEVNHQGTESEYLLFRDTVDAALAGEVPVAGGETIPLTLEVRNLFFDPSVRVQARITDAEGVQTALPVQEAEIPPMETARVDLGGVPLPRPGYFRLSYSVETADGIHAGDHYQGYVACRNVQPLAEIDRRGVDLSVQSDLDTYLLGMEGTFTIHLWNHGDTDRNLRVDYRFPHNRRYAEDRGLYQQSVERTVAADGEEQITLTLPVVNKDGIDRLWVKVYDAGSGEQLAAGSKGFYTEEPETTAVLSPDIGDGPLRTGGALPFTFAWANPYGEPVNATLRFQVVDSAGGVLAETERSARVEERFEEEVTLALPDEAFSGQATVQCFVESAGRVIGRGQAHFPLLGPTHDCSGRVVDLFSGEAVPEARLAFHLGEMVYEAVTDAGGDFAVRLPAGAFNLEITAPGYNTFATAATLDSASGQAGLWQLVPRGESAGTGRVHGVVRDKVTGQPVPFAELAVHGKRDLSVTADRSGRYSMALPAGRYDVRVVTEGVPSGEQFRLEVLEGLSLRSDLVVRRDALRFDVRDAVTGEPLPGATVVLEHRRDRVSFDHIPSAERVFRVAARGEWKARVRREGYRELETELYASRRPTTHSFYLRKKAYPFTLVFRSFLGDLPLEGVSLTVEEKRGKERRSLATDDQGRVTGELPEGRWVLRAEKRGYRTLETELRHGPWSDAPQNHYLRRERFPCTVRVLGYESGETVSGVSLSLEQARGDGEREATTGVDGEAGFDLAPGRWKIAFERDGYRQQETEFFHSANARGRTDTYYLLEERTGTLPLEVRDLVTGELLPDVQIALRHRWNDQEEITKSDVEGRAAFDTSEGRISLVFDREGYRKLETECFYSHRDETLRTFYLHPAERTLPLQVAHLQTEEPLEGVQVLVRSGNEWVSRGATDADGRVTLRLANGRQQLRFLKEGFIQQETEFFLQSASPPPERRRVYLIEHRTPFVGRVVDHAGTPIPDVEVLLQQGKDEKKLIRTGPDGGFTEELLLGRYEVQLSAEGYLPGKTQIYAGRAQEPGEWRFVLERKDAEPREGRGNVIYHLYDAVTGEPLEGFSYRHGGWHSAAGATVRLEADGGNHRTQFNAPGYHDSGTFYPATYPGMTCRRRIFLWPKDGETVYTVRDALTGNKLDRFWGFTERDKWRIRVGGILRRPADYGKERLQINAPGYHGTDYFYPAGYPGRRVARQIYLTPKEGRIIYHLYDALTLERLPLFAGYHQRGDWRPVEGGVMTVTAEPGHKRTDFNATGYHGTGAFYPETVPGRTLERSIYLWPTTGAIRFTVHDALTGDPVEPVSTYFDRRDWGDSPAAFTEEGDDDNHRTEINHVDYHDTGAFYPRPYPGRLVSRDIALWPRLGTVTVRPVDALTGKVIGPVSSFWDPRNWRRATGVFTVEGGDDNERMEINMPGHHGIGAFYPRAYPGKDVTRTYALWPSRGAQHIRVLDLLTGEPVENAGADLYGQGGWRLFGGGTTAALGDGNRRLNVVAPGYLDAGDWHPPIFGGRELLRELYLVPEKQESRVTVKVTDSVTGKPLAGARVYEGGDLRGRTGFDGEVRLTTETRFDRRRYRAEAEGYHRRDLTANVAGNQESVLVTIPLDERIGRGKGSVAVSVAASGGAALDQAEVTLRKGSDTHTSLSTSAGQASFSDIETGIYTLSVSREGYLPESRRVALRPERRPRVSLRLEALEASGRPEPFTPVIAALEGPATLRAGETGRCRLVVENRGDLSGHPRCVLEAPGIPRQERPLSLRPGESRELLFNLEIPADAPGGNLPLRFSVGGVERTFTVVVDARPVEVTPRLDKPFYRPGETASLELAVHLEDNSEPIPLFWRVTFGGFTDRGSFVLTSEDTTVTVPEIPVSFRGSKLVYGLYYENGSAIVLDALYVNPATGIRIRSDRQRYESGEEVTLFLNGKPDSAVLLESPLFEGEARVPLSAEGSGTYAFYLPHRVATGSYPVRVGGLPMLNVDVAGMGVTLRDQRLLPPEIPETALSDEVGRQEYTVALELDSPMPMRLDWEIYAEGVGGSERVGHGRRDLEEGRQVQEFVLTLEAERYRLLRFKGYTDTALGRELMLGVPLSLR
ncbi:MAG: carboxypeptidase-like regulatory domain-containing protein [Synergistales bacterium]|nr:carboxypeptidase-like regulatory domain-containing protein [Synergistales bacterium]